MTLKVMIVTKSDLRHRLFLRLAKNALGDNWVATCVQALDDDRGAATGGLRQRLLTFARKARKSTRTWFSTTDNRPVDLFVREMLSIAPLPESDIPGLMRAADPNSEEVRAHLRAVAPDIVLVYGASILKSDWLTVPRLGAMNMHYGMLPWYRSSNSTQFALLHERPDRVGATVHYIDAGIDTGSIVRRFPVSPDGHNSVNELVAAVYVAGARGLLSCAQDCIASKARLVGTRELFDRSFYPAKAATSNVIRGARWRLTETRSPWPHTEASVEKFSLLKPPLLRREQRLPNGVYVLLYHSLTDNVRATAWERSYRKTATDVVRFAEHMTFMISEAFRPLPLSDAPEMLRRGTADGRYFVVTFDDAYSNIADMEPFLARQGIVPTVFVNGAFCEGAAYFRVLAAVLRDSDGTGALHDEMRTVAPDVPWSMDPVTLFNQTKDIYLPGKTEVAVAAAYAKAIGNPKDLRCHLDLDRLSSLQKKGWQIGNHTWEHMTLSAQKEPEVDEAIERNFEYLRSAGLQPIDWLSYPNGLARHVSPAVKEWLDRHPDTNGIFAGGGVNLIHSRTQWLRISIGNPDLANFKRIIGQNVDATVKAIGLPR